jgi:hypothetical protein
MARQFRSLENRRRSRSADSVLSADLDALEAIRARYAYNARAWPTYSMSVLFFSNSIEFEKRHLMRRAPHDGSVASVAGRWRR